MAKNPFATITLSPLKSFDEVEVAAENTAYRIEWAPRLWHGHHVNERREYRVRDLQVEAKPPCVPPNSPQSDR
jgi:hypothetical protein